ncbi:MAG: hypothetical protein ABIS86_07945 [Streptosporangiaceae bacterium]
MPDIAAEKRYRELVRLAYLILPGRGSREYRLAMARRIVDRNLPRRPVSGKAFTDARERVLRQAMKPPRRLRVRLVPWLRGLPPTVPGNAALAELTPDLRTAYVLRRVTGLRRYVVHDLLIDLGSREAQEVLDLVEDMPDLNVVAPGAVGRRRRFRRSRLPILVASGLTCAMVGGLAVENRTHSVATARSTRPVAVPAGAPAKAVVPPPQPGQVRWWAGRLPGKGGRGEFACRTSTLPDGTVRRSGVLLWRDAVIVTRGCADGMTGTWWRSPKKRWYYLAAAAPHVRMRLTGRRSGLRDGLLVARGTKGKTPPLRPIVLSAR